MAMDGPITDDMAAYKGRIYVMGSGVLTPDEVGSGTHYEFRLYSFG